MHFRDEGGASLHPNGTRFIAGGSDLWVRVFDYETGNELECHKGHHGPVSGATREIWALLARLAMVVAAFEADMVWLLLLLLDAM